MIANTRVSDLVATQLPAFIRDDHETFVSFMEAYYEFLEQDGNMMNESSNLLEYYDIEKTTDDFAQHLYNEFIQAMPSDLTADKNIVLKNIRDFYRSRGSEKSLKFLLRVLYGLEATVYYPKKDILRWDDGKWFVQKTLRVQDVQLDGVSNNNLSGLGVIKNKKIIGQSSNASAVVERVDRFYEYGEQINEVVLSSIVGNFIPGETIDAYVNANNVSNLTANILSSGVLNLQILDGGFNYDIGDRVIFESTTGANANAFVSSISAGNVTNLSITYSGAGFLANDEILITGTGSGANGTVIAIDDGETYHPNTYTIYTTTVGDLANTIIGAADYVNVSHAIISSPNANSIMAQTWTSFAYGPCGPLSNISIVSEGSGFRGTPTISVYANTIVTNMGILGRMEVYDGGTGYANTDTIEFINTEFGAGTGAAANVEVDGSGTIVRTYFVEQSGFPIGGIGYSQQHLPTANIVTSTGSGANVRVTAILGDGEIIKGGNGSIGVITGITLTNRGENYAEAPTVNLTASGSGTANVRANIISGLFSYPGRYKNDDGFLDSYNFLADRDYYQEYSYEIRVMKTLNKYRKAVMDLLHPSGVKMFGRYVLESTVQNEATGFQTVIPQSTEIFAVVYDSNGESLLTSANGTLIVGQ